MAELRFPDPPLADEVVLLRPWAAPDVPGIFTMFADPLVQRFSWPLTTAYTHEDARRYFMEQENERLRGEAVHFAFAEPGDPAAVLGGGSVYGIDRQQGRAAVGYWLAPGTRGRGVGDLRDPPDGRLGVHRTAHGAAGADLRAG
jgi:RimJ/RimL family protein N-acetyltransferase